MQLLQTCCLRRGIALSACMSSMNPADQVKPVLNWALWVLVIALSFVQLFATFRGLSSAAAMDQAQVARELARGHGLSTRMIRPAAVQQMTTAGKAPDLLLMPDTMHPPLQSLLWAPIFKALASDWSFPRGTSIYSLDRAAACLGGLFMLLTLLLVHGMARRMFDRTLANFVVLALGLSKPLWEIFIYHGARGTLVLLTTLALYWLMKLIARVQNDEPLGLLPLLIGLVCAAMVMTHWLALWLVLGLIVAVALLLPTRRGASAVITLLPLLALGGWCARNIAVCGDPLGSAKALLQTTLARDGIATLQRDYENVTPPVVPGALLHDLNQNFAAQFQFSWEHLLGVVPALLFFLALLHRFRRQEVATFCWAVGILLLTMIVGMSLFDLPARSLDDYQIQAALTPVLTVFGLAGFAVMWARFHAGRPSSLWTQHGYAILAILIGGWPMLMGLTSDLRTGMFLKGKLMQWPPYRPDTTSQLAGFVKDDELLVSDAPWSVAWYADRSCLWLPKTRDQFTRLRDVAEQQQKHHIAGFVMSPVSTQDSTFTMQFASPYSEWMELVARGPTMVLGHDLAQNVPWLRDYPKLLPLGAIPMPDGRRVPAVCFYADRERWLGTK